MSFKRAMFDRTQLFSVACSGFGVVVDWLLDNLSAVRARSSTFCKEKKVLLLMAKLIHERRAIQDLCTLHEAQKVLILFGKHLSYYPCVKLEQSNHVPCLTVG